MLQSLRKSVRSIFIQILFALLVLSFAVWGIGDTFFFGFSDNNAAEVGSREIPLEEVDAAFRREVNQLRALNIDAARAREIEVLDQVVSTLVGRALLAEEADRLGLDVSEDTIVEAIRADRTFHNQFGEFDRNRFAQVLAVSGFSEDTYLASLRQDILRNQLILSTTPGRTAPAPSAQALFAWRYEQRIAEVLRIADDPALDVGTPSEGVLSKIHTERADEFTAPEYRAVTYLHLQPRDLVDEVRVAEDVIRDAYESRIEQFTKPERRTVRQLLFDSAEDAEKAAVAVAGGTAFADVPDSFPAGTVQISDFGLVTRNELPLEALAETAFALAPGAVSRPLQSPFGWHLVQAGTVEPESVTPLEDVREEIRHDIAHDDAMDVMLRIVHRLEDSLGGGATLEEAAAEIDLPVRSIAAIDRRGLGPDGQRIEAVPSAPFLDEVAEAERGQPGFVTETDDGTFFVLRVDSIIPSALRPLDEVREEVSAAWAAERRREATRERAEAARDRLAQPGSDPAAVAQEFGATVEELPPITRDGEGAPNWVPRTLVSSLFALARPGELALTETMDGYALIRFQSAIPADPAADTVAFEQFREQQAQLFAQDLRTQYGLALQERHGVTINQAAIDRAFNARPAE